jgi:putative glutamine amidotransferase
MKKKKPLIGVTTSARRGHFMWWCTHLGIKLAGGKAIRITALNDEDHKICDGYVISGGVDIDPQCYGQENTASIDIEPERDTLEQEVIAHALKHKKPLMGICRGAQMINVVQGGTLHQNVRDFYENFVPSDSLLGKIFSRRLIHVIDSGVLFDLFNQKRELSVNSLHHQAIYKLGKELKVVAKDELGIVQAIESSSPEKNFILGVQWHPEFMLHSEPHRRLFISLVQRAIS